MYSYTNKNIDLSFGFELYREDEGEHRGSNSKMRGQAQAYVRDDYIASFPMIQTPRCLASVMHYSSNFVSAAIPCPVWLILKA